MKDLYITKQSTMAQNNLKLKNELINIKVLFFAGLKDLFKKSDLSLSVPGKTTVGELREKLFDGIEKKEERWKALMYAVNHNYAPLDTKLREGDEVAFLPFVSGG